MLLLSFSLPFLAIIFAQKHNSMNTENLSSLISALRNETQADSISPDSLGSILQKIAQLLEQAALSDEVHSLLQWRSQIMALPPLISAITSLENDPDDAVLKCTFQYLNGTSPTEGVVSISGATANRAGAMSADQVSEINQLSTTAMRTGTDIAALQMQAQAILNLCDDLDGRITNLSGSSSQTSSNFKQFISCQAVAQSLYIKANLTEINNLNLVPYIFRYSKKQSRYRFNRSENRRKGKKRKGWHVLYGHDKCRIDNKGKVTVRCDWEGANNGLYLDSPQILFSELKTKTFNGTLQQRIAFGKKTYDVRNTAHKFKFGIAFGLPSSRQSPFKITKLRTNIAEFYVLVYYDAEEEEMIFVYAT